MSRVVLLGHGSRAPQAAESMERVARELGRRRGEAVAVAYMELAEPSLGTTLARLHAQGVREVVLVPYFLHLGIHLREDIPGLLEEILAGLPGLSVTLASHLGYDEALVDVVERRLAEAEEPRG